MCSWVLPYVLEVYHALRKSHYTGLASTLSFSTSQAKTAFRFTQLKPCLQPHCLLKLTHPILAPHITSQLRHYLDPKRHAFKMPFWARFRGSGPFLYVHLGQAILLGPSQRRHFEDQSLVPRRRFWTSFPGPAAFLWNP